MTMIGRASIAAALLLAACQANVTSAPTVDRSHRTSPPTTSCKPEAPVTVEIATRDLGDGELEITARATPTAEVGSVELSLAMPSHATALGATNQRFGASAAGEAHAMTTRLRADRRTSTITAIARVPVGDIIMSRTATIEIGTPLPPPRTTTYTLPDGERATEVLP